MRLANALCPRHPQRWTAFAATVIAIDKHSTVLGLISLVLFHHA